jgi:hypothetical protein
MKTLYFRFKNMKFDKLYIVLKCVLFIINMSDFVFLYSVEYKVLHSEILQFRVFIIRYL